MEKLFWKAKPITIVDSVMGSGKTSWAIQYLMQHKEEKRFLFVTPFLSEIDRLIEATNGEFVTPAENRNKLPQLKEMLQQNKNIACSHELLKDADRELLNIFEEVNYTLVLDEALDVVTQIDMKSADVEYLFRTYFDGENCVASYDSKGKVTWHDDDYNGDKYSSVKNAAKTGNLYLYKSDEDRNPAKKGQEESYQLFWVFPPEIFKAFNEVCLF